MMKPPHNKQHGIAIIELMVGVLIISFGLLGLITLQGRALQASVGSEDSQRAALLAHELVSTMVNQNTVALPAAVVEAWNVRVADPANAGLPNGVGTVTPVNANEARITVTWRPVNAAAGATNRYITDVVIP